MADRTYKALLIANWKFPRDPALLPSLRGPQIDVRLMYRALTNRRTGLHSSSQVTALRNSTRGTIMQRLEDFLHGALPNDQLLIYYSGHGQLNLFDELFLCAKDTQTDRLHSTGIAATAISSMIDSSRAVAKVLLLDCCYSGNFKSGGHLPGKLAGEGRFVLSSSRSAQLTADAEGVAVPSPFTQFLADTLLAGAPDTDGDGYVSIDDVYARVLQQMRQANQSTPQRSFAAAVDTVALAKVYAPPPRRTARETSQRLRRGARLPRSTTWAAPVDPTAVHADFIAGRAAERAGQLWVARAHYQRVVASDYGDWSVLAAYQLAKTVYVEGDLKAAKVAYEQVIVANHRDWSPECACRLGDLLVASRAPNAAVKAYRHAVDSGHSEWSPMAANRLGDLLVQQGDLFAARSLYERAMDSGHADWAPRAMAHLGDLLVHQGEKESAKAIYQRATLSGHHNWAPPSAVKLGDLHAADGCRIAAASAYHIAAAANHETATSLAQAGIQRLEASG